MAACERNRSMASDAAVLSAARGSDTIAEPTQELCPRPACAPARRLSRVLCSPRSGGEWPPFGRHSLRKLVLLPAHTTLRTPTQVQPYYRFPSTRVHLQPHKHAIFPILRQIAELDNVRTY